MENIWFNFLSRIASGCLYKRSFWVMILQDDADVMQIET